VYECAICEKCALCEKCANVDGRAAGYFLCEAVEAVKEKPLGRWRK
jgi:hypothetical protein